MFAFFPLVSLLGIFLLENGKADPFYRRVIGGKKKSLIIGTSKAAQGIDPSVLNQELGLVGGDEIYNFGFTIAHSPFGEAYSNAINKKLASDSKDAFFIVTVDPWAFSSSKEDPNNKELMNDQYQFLGKLHSFSSLLNFEYLLKYYINSYYEILLRYVAVNSMHLQENGWLKVTPKMEGDQFEKLTLSKILEYENKFQNLKFSEYRFQSFIELLDYLSVHGQVFVVRMPVDKRIYYVENKIFHDLNIKVGNFCASKRIPFVDFNLNLKGYKYVDGVHLLNKSTGEFSMDIANWIIKSKIKEN